MHRKQAFWKFTWLGLFLATSLVAESPTTTTAPATTQPATQPTGQLIEGIVLNYYGGGIPEARIRIESLDSSAEDPPLAEGRTNQTGDIMIQLPQPVDSSVRVRIEKEGYIGVVQEIDPTDEEDPPFIDVALEGAAQITGTIREKNTGDPVADAHVECYNGGRSFESITNADGSYVLKNVYRGSAKIIVRADGFAIEQKMVKIESDKTEAHLEIQPERLLDLTVVTNEGEPADKVIIEAIVEPQKHFLSAVTDQQGRTEIHGISPEADLVRLRLNGEGYVRSHEYTEVIEFPASQPAASRPHASYPSISQRLVVTVAARIRGTVVDSQNGEPVVGVRVIAGREVRPDMPMIWTSLDGTYELTELPPGLNVISYQHVEYATVVREIQLNTGKTGTIDIKLDKGRPIGGMVTDKEGNPLSQVRVSAEDWKGYKTLGLRTITDEEGKFFFPNAPAEGEIEYSFVLPGYGPVVSKVLTSGNKDYRIELEAKAQPEYSMEMEPKIAVGQRVPDLSMTSMDGTVYKLSKLRGKYVFIDCWATWCGPCLREIPHVKNLHNAMKENPNFVMIGVSLDSDREALKEAIEEHEIVWPQIFGPKSGANEAFDTLNGFGIPFTALVGPDGKLLAQDLRGPEMAEQVKRTISKNKAD